jgi:hypothetical protein
VESCGADSETPDGGAPKDRQNARYDVIDRAARPVMNG